MLKYEVAKELYEKIKQAAMENDDEDFRILYEECLNDAVIYAGKRAGWEFMSDEERKAADENRSMLHNAYISMLDAICRNLEIDGIYETLPDRKTIGDFACYIALFIGLEWR